MASSALAAGTVLAGIAAGLLLTAYPAARHNKRTWTPTSAPMMTRRPPTAEDIETSRRQTERAYDVARRILLPLGLFFLAAFGLLLALAIA